MERWAGNVICMGEVRNACRLVKNLTERDHLEDLVQMGG